MQRGTVCAKRREAACAGHGFSRLDVLTALALFVLTLALGLGILNKGHSWGDDFAGYMLQAQTIVEGNYEEQAQLNALLHPSPRSFEEGVVDDSPLVYVWGLPMVLSLIYRLVGYDAPVGEMLIYYKIPGAVFFAVFAAALFLFYRRRFCYAVSLFLTFMLCSHSQAYGEINSIMTDIPCMAASMALLLGMELFVEEERRGRRAALGLVLGVAMWYAYTVRLNGLTVVLCALLYQALAILKNRETGKRLLRHVLPWALFLALCALTRLCLPEPTSNTSDMAGVTLNRIKDNVLYYDALMEAFVGRMLPEWVPGGQYLHLVLYVLMAAGLLDRGWRREDIHLAILLCGTGAVLLMLPYVQELRYMFNILPLMLLFGAYGAAAMIRRAGRLARSAGVRRILACAACVLLLGVSALRVAGLAMWKQEEARLGGRERLYEAYIPDARDVYAYIGENVEEDAVIAFIKPRLLYLNTHRVAIYPGVNGHHFYDADYLLTFAGRTDELGYMLWPELLSELTLVYENHEFELYRISDAYRSLRYE